MTFRCMPAFQTLGGGDCGASWSPAKSKLVDGRNDVGVSQFSTILMMYLLRIQDTLTLLKENKI
ncbi:hypothetical protein DBV15_05702 [Temnothorax longispinosus]|uniref:Uncharacterized protein n=1 Tax=Temnothorax longispinosus TaxID=300112 RepID=A0A4S2JA38_9HYME|nr:hypothetical protein DBV15_05702 [Temnothorax longispinosus]